MRLLIYSYFKSQAFTTDELAGRLAKNKNFEPSDYTRARDTLTLLRHLGKIENLGQKQTTRGGRQQLWQLPKAFCEEIRRKKLINVA